MRRITPIFLLIGLTAFSQSVSVDNTSYSSSQLADLLLDDICVEISNVSVSSEAAVAYFNNNGGAFPISEGVVIRTGQAQNSGGPYTGQNLSSQLNSNSDAFLYQLNAASGQSPSITDVAFMQFDFVPLSSNFNFDFLFASNEYGQWQCLSSDVFAFMLIDLATSDTLNLAVIPGTNTPVSVKSIKDKQYNPSCQSNHPGLFASYEVDNPASTINMRGYTVVMNASSQITPGNPYRIRMVIGDSNDADFDSAIFLSAGSFNTNLNLGSNRVICDGDEFILKTGLDTSIYSHTWTLNGNVLPGETGNTLTVTQSGTYGVTIIRNGSGCILEDEIVFTELQVQSPQDLMLCHSDTGMYTYDLTLNDESVLGINNKKYDLEYYASLSDLNAGNPISSSDLSAFQSFGNQKIYIKIFNKNTGLSCTAVYEFDLLVNQEIQLQPPGPIEVCANTDDNIDLTQHNAQIITGNYNFSFFYTQANAQNNVKAIANPQDFPIPPGNIFTVWVRVEDASKPECFEVISLDVVINPPPPVDSLPDVTECTAYVLPPLQDGNYFSGPDGSGTPFFAGDSIEETGTYYIFSGPDANGCTNQSSFGVTLVDEYVVKEKHCGKFTVPAPPAGSFYTAPGGPAGAGVHIPAGTVLTTSQTIYHYAEINGVFCRDEAFEITIFPLPPVDSLSDVVTCNQFVLPVLTNGNYFTKPKGKGTQLSAGEVITTTQTIYIFSDDGRCTNQTKFEVVILPDFQDVVACGSYTLPQVDIGGFFTQPGGQGQQIPDGTVFSTTPPNTLVETVYYYATTTTTPNCTENLSFSLTVFPIPEVDELDDVLLCEGETFVLPPLTHGEYFTKPNRKGTPLSPGEVISTTSTIYINNTENSCSAETDFVVEIRPAPEVEQFTDIYSCEAFELPDLKHGKYYTEPGGNGQMLSEGSLIHTTQKLYIFNAYEDFPSCYSENAFTIYVQGIEVGEFDDVLSCDLYVLPDLETGNYFTQSGGKGDQLFPGDTLKTDHEIFVFGINGERFPCTDEDSFLVNISNTPQLPVFEDVEACGSYVLPDLSQEEYDVGYYYEPNGKSPIPPSEYGFTRAGNYTIYIYATAKNNPACFDQTAFLLSIYPRPDLEIPGGTICFDSETGEVVSSPLLQSGLNPSAYTVNWYLDGKLMHSGSDFSPEVAGNYIVETEKLTPEIGGDCNFNSTRVQVYESAQPIIRAQVTEPFSDRADIRVEVISGVGDYEYQLDDEGFVSENIFRNVESGLHTIRVRGVNGACGEAVLEVEVLHFPKFFTPNNDGHNDRWNIPDLKNHPEAEILIFDRYGKLLASLKPNRSGWDGTYHGNPMPSDDYWFVVSFERNGKKEVFKSHFSLIR